MDKWIKKKIIGFIFESVIKCHKPKGQQRPPDADKSADLTSESS